MNIEQRIIIIDQKLEELRKRWDGASQPMKKILWQDAKLLNSEKSMLERVLRRKIMRARGETDKPTLF